MGGEDTDEADEEADGFEDEARREDLPDHEVAPEDGGGKHRGQQAERLGRRNKKMFIQLTGRDSFPPSYL